jgi:hypothetical protein
MPEPLQLLSSLRCISKELSSARKSMDVGDGEAMDSRERWEVGGRGVREFRLGSQG